MPRYVELLSAAARATRGGWPPSRAGSRRPGVLERRLALVRGQLGRGREGRCHNGAVSEQHTPAPGGSVGCPGAAASSRPPRRPEPSAPRKRGLGGGVLLAGALIFKFGAKLKALLLLLPKLKLFTTSASMLVSIAAYSLIWGWTFALGFVLLLLVHEMGHVIQLRREGVEPAPAVHPPWAPSSAPSRWAATPWPRRVGLAGPVLGSLGAAALGPVALATDNDFWFALAFTGFFLNLFNLLPVVPLDGGRAFAAMAPWMWFVGLFAVVVLCFVAPNPILLLIALFSGLETWRRWRERRKADATTRAYYAVRPAPLAVGADLPGARRAARGGDGSHVRRALARRRLSGPRSAVHPAQRPLHVALRLARADRLALVEAVLAARSA